MFSPRLRAALQPLAAQAEGGTGAVQRVERAAIWTTQRHADGVDLRQPFADRHAEAALRDALAPLGDSSNWPLAGDIAGIEVRGFKFLAFLNRRDIRNAFATRFSTPFAVASVIVNRSHGLDCFDDRAAANPDIHALVDKLALVEYLKTL